MACSELVAWYTVGAITSRKATMTTASALEQNLPSIALGVLHAPHPTKQERPVQVSGNKAGSGRDDMSQLCYLALLFNL